MKKAASSIFHSKVRKIIFIFCILYFSIGNRVAIFAQNENNNTFTDKYFTYELRDSPNEAIIVKLTDPQREEYEVPAQISANGKDYTIISFGYSPLKGDDSPFYNNQSLTSIKLPNNKMTIQYAFTGCSNLKSIIIPEKVYRYDGAFLNCTSLTNVTINSTCEYVCENAFEGCTSLQSITIPEGVIHIQGGAFHGCSSLTSVVLPSTLEGMSGGEHTSSGSGMAGDVDIYGAFEGCTSLTTIKLPNKIKYIPNFTFNNCGLKEITLPNELEGIASYAFSKCPDLEQISIPGSLKEIGSYAFSESGIKSISIPPTVKNIGKYAFYKCNKLEEVILPNTNLNYNFTFVSCENLQKITIPLTPDNYYNQTFNQCSSLKTITFYESNLSDIFMGDIFKGCTSLQSVKIPEGVTQLYATFIGCTNLSEIILPKSLKLISFTFRNCTSLKTFTIPDQVNDISAAFQGCTGLTQMTIPANAQTNYNAFKDCKNLRTITIKCDNLETQALGGCDNLEEIHLESTTGTRFASDTFTGIDKSTCIVYVPKGTLNLYENWAGFKTILEEGSSATNCIITYNLQNLSCNPQPESIGINQKLETTLTADKNYLLPPYINVTMGKQKLENGNGYNYDWTSGYFSIPVVTDDIQISASGTENIYYKVSYQLQHLQANPYHPDSIKKDKLLDIILQPDSGYTIPSEIQVSMGEITLTANQDYTWNTDKWLLTIPKVTGDILIIASAIQNEDADDNEDPKPEIIPVIGISLNYTNLTLTVGETADLKAIIQPTNASNQSVNWSITNPSVATIGQTGIIAIAPGETDITAQTVDGNFQAICKVNVLRKTIIPDIEEKTDSTVTISWAIIPEASYYILKVFDDAGKQKLVAEYKFDENGKLRSTLFFFKIEKLLSGHNYYIETTALKQIENETIILAQNTVYTQTSGTPVSNTDLLVNKPSIRITNGQIVIQSPLQCTIQIFNLSGQCIFVKKISGTEYISLPSGSYIVVMGKERHKIRL